MAVSAQFSQRLGTRVSANRNVLTVSTHQSTIPRPFRPEESEMLYRLLI